MINKVGKNTNEQNASRTAGPVIYEIKVQGHLDPVWSQWLEGMTLTQCENEEGGGACTLIAGPVVDQPALHGLLAKIGSLNLTLISVRRIDPRKGTAEEVPIDPPPSGDRGRPSSSS